ncbi:MAG: hypothetical protein V4543_14360 [Bacteroidota bacterium]
MKKILMILLMLPLFGISISLKAQNADEKTVTASGVGSPRDEALNDALRNAVGQATGIELQSQTQVENFELISDAIQTRVNGYVAGYDIVSENNREGLVTINVKARISTKALKADAQYLARAVGGIRFLVMYDEREFKDPAQKAQMDFAVERINQYLASKKYRYIEKTRFEQIRREAANILEDSDTNDLSYVQQLGVKSGAQFIIMLKGFHTETREQGAFGTKVETQMVMDIKAYDNCTAEGLGTVVLEGPWKSAYSVDAANTRNAISETIMTKTDKLMEVFNQYIAEWVNNGTPFELRFMGSGSFRDLSELRRRLKADKAFGGQMELVGAEGYMALNCTFRNKPEDLADRVLSLSDEIEALKAQRMDVKLIYGRQITFSPGTGGTAPAKSAAVSKTVEAGKAKKAAAKTVAKKKK